MKLFFRIEMVPKKKVLTPVLSSCITDSIVDAHRKHMRTSGVKAGRHACTICVGGQLSGVGPRHALEVLAAPAGCIVAAGQSNSSNINIPAALASPLHCLAL